MTLEPGIYPGIPWETYLQWPGLNASRLVEGIMGDGSISALHLRQAMESPDRPSTPDQRLGRAIHTRLLEPEAFADRHPIAGQCQGMLKSGENKGKQCIYQAILRAPDGQWFCKNHAGEDAFEPDGMIPASEAARIEELAVAIGKHPAIRLFKAQAATEVSIAWDMPVTFFVAGKQMETVLRMKGRVDKDIARPVSASVPPMIVDLKKARAKCHTDEEFAWACRKFHYYVKAAIYVDAMKILDGIERQFCWAVIEDSPPYDVNPIQADAATLELGRRKYRAVLAAYAAAKHTGSWPGIAPEAHRGGLPEWFLRRHEPGSED